MTVEPESGDAETPDHVDLAALDERIAVWTAEKQAQIAHHARRCG